MGIQGCVLDYGYSGLCQFLPVCRLKIHQMIVCVNYCDFVTSGQDYYLLLRFGLKNFFIFLSDGEILNHDFFSVHG